MAAPPKIYQGTHKNLIVTTNISLSAASEIELRVDTAKQIVKTLTNGDISNVTSTQFEVAFVPGDTDNTVAGDYKYEVVATDSSSNKVHGKFSPDKITIAPSIFTTLGSGKDYN